MPYIRRDLFIVLLACLAVFFVGLGASGFIDPGDGYYTEGAREMIVVLPDTKTAHNGSMYSSSVTTGDFERFKNWIVHHATSAG